MRVTAFTCLVGATPDRVRVPGFISPSVRYICLTDRPTSPFPYRHVPVSVPLGQSAPLFARQLKILADHPEIGGTDVILWHDAAFRLDIDPALVARQTLSGFPTREIAALEHPHRTQIEDEAAEIVRLGYADAATVTAQAASYRALGWTQQMTLTSTGYVLRRRTDTVSRFDQVWWAEVERWCWRDQMSVDYALWKTGLSCHYLPGHYRDNRYARWFKAGSPVRPQIRPSPIAARPITRPARPSWPYRIPSRPLR